MSAHDWYDLLPDYAFGLLAPEEAAAFERQLSINADLRSEFDRYQQVIDELPFAVAPLAPPASIKRDLIAKIQREAAKLPAHPAAARPQRAWAQRSGFAAVALLIALLTGALYTTSAQLSHSATMNQQLAQQLAAAQQSIQDLRQQQQQIRADLQAARASEQRLATDLQTRSVDVERVRAQIHTDEQTLGFLTANDLALQPLAAGNSGAGTQGAMFMRPGQREAVVLIRGLPQLAQAQTYQFWVAQGAQQVNLGALEVGTDGIGRLRLQAPAPVDSYAQMMVTIEQHAPVATPSDQIVLQGTLS